MSLLLFVFWVLFVRERERERLREKMGKVWGWAPEFEDILSPDLHLKVDRNREVTMGCMKYLMFDV